MSVVKQPLIHERRGMVLVKQGFSWPAFFFGALWAAAKGLWFPAFLTMMVLDVGLWFLSGYAEAQGQFALAGLGAIAVLVYAFARGHFGNELLRSGLLRKGFVAGKTR